MEKRPALPALTGLRFFAALGVVLTHSLHSLWGAPLANANNPAALLLNNVSQNGYLGVNVFFLLSGFILVYTYVGSAGLTGTKRAFWVARFARIYPVYLFAWLAFGGLVVWHHAADWWPASPVLTAVSSLFLQQSWWPATAYYWNGPGWTLADEAVFYASFPLLIPLLRLPNKVLIRSLAGLYSVVCAAALLDVRFAHLPATAHNPLMLLAAGDPFIRLPEFAAGMILGMLFIRRAFNPVQMRALAVPALVLTFTGLALGGHVTLAWGEHGVLDPVFALLILTLAYDAGRFARLLSLPALVLLGEASYSVYILHEPIALWLQAEGLVPASGSRLFWPFLVLYVALVVIGSVVVYHLMETPARRFIRRRWSTPGIRSTSNRRILLASLVAASGLLAWQLNTQAHTKAPVGFIGDSITAMGTPLAATVRPINQGHSGSDTTAWLPGNPDHFLSKAIAAFHRAHVQVVSVMLGTNDAREGISPARYHAQLTTLAHTLAAAGFRVVLQHPPYLVPGKLGVTPDTDRRLLAYWGRSPAYVYFQEHPNQLSDGVHPTVAGMRALGAIWAVALAQS